MIEWAEFYCKFFFAHGNKMFNLENIIYSTMEQLITEDSPEPVTWGVKKVDGAAMYLCPEVAGNITLNSPGMMQSYTLTPDAAGIAVTLFALSHVAGAVYEISENRAEIFIENFHGLRDWASHHHEEFNKIMAVID
ncbi:antirestriction protein [Kistimonas asteriae]|uniref:antirestriction protein n=1 Tax=Kistimonas asteriae TaxID=517724 RepID=UPI001BA9C38B|nr:antirestriction protein [Kistimonas asteriae]